MEFAVISGNQDSESKKVIRDCLAFLAMARAPAVSLRGAEGRVAMSVHSNQAEMVMWSPGCFGGKEGDEG
jgi:hypothetical protein